MALLDQTVPLYLSGSPTICPCGDYRQGHASEAASSRAGSRGHLLAGPMRLVRSIWLSACSSPSRRSSASRAHLIAMRVLPGDPLSAIAARRARTCSPGAAPGRRASLSWTGRTWCSTGLARGVLRGDLEVVLRGEPSASSSSAGPITGQIALMPSFSPGDRLAGGPGLACGGTRGRTYGFGSGSRSSWPSPASGGADDRFLSLVLPSRGDRP